MPFFLGELQYDVTARAFVTIFCYMRARKCLYLLLFTSQLKAKAKERNMCHDTSSTLAAASSRRLQLAATIRKHFAVHTLRKIHTERMYTLVCPRTMYTVYQRRVINTSNLVMYTKLCRVITTRTDCTNYMHAIMRQSSPTDI